MHDFYNTLEKLPARYGDMYVPAYDSVIARSIRAYGEWAQHEIDFVAAHLHDGGTILDVGANIGTHTLAFSSLFPSSTIVAFEPQPFIFQTLSANVLVNRRGNTRLLNVACGEKKRFVNVQFNYEKLDYNFGAFSLEDAVASNRVSAGAVPIPVIPIDTLSFDRPVQLIKIDVEGMEFAVLKGALRVIRHWRPVLCFEVLKIESVSPIVEWLRSLDYRLYWLETWPYNRNNLLGNPSNIWSRCEMSIIAFPAANSSFPQLPPVTGAETDVPYVKDATSGYASENSAMLPEESTTVSLPEELADSVEVIVHVGLPKSGSTSIQQSLKANREELLRAGIFYAPSDNPFPNDYPVYQAVKDGDWARAEVYLADRLWRAKQAGARYLVISSEELIYLAEDRDVLQQFLALFRRPRIILVERDIAAYLRSLAIQYLWNGASVADDLNTANFTLRLIERYIREANAEVVSFDQAIASGGLFRNFIAQICGVDRPWNEDISNATPEKGLSGFILAGVLARLHAVINDVHVNSPAADDVRSHAYYLVDQCAGLDAVDNLVEQQLKRLVEATLAATDPELLAAHRARLVSSRNEAPVR